MSLGFDPTFGLGAMYNGSDGGSTNDTQPLTPPPDPTGGSGSYAAGLLDTLSNGINATLGNGTTQQIGSLIGLAAVNAAGGLVYRANAGQQVKNNAATQAVINSTPVYPGQISSTTLLMMAAAAAIVLIVALR